jgi:hypothetical protein
MDKKPRYIPAFHFYLLNFIYDPILRLVREKTFKTALVKQAGLEKGHRALEHRLRDGHAHHPD